MKILTTNFLTCAVKACKSSPSSFPLRFRDATLERTEIDFNPLFIRNILPRVDWEALKGTASDLGLAAMVPETNPVETTDQDEDESMQDDENDTAAAAAAAADTDAPTETKAVDEEVLRKLHTLLLETAVVEGKLVCGNCGFEYPIREGVGNFLLPAHLV